MADLIGQRLGQYEIIAKVGAGGMATVYRARQLTIKREVAIKVIRSDRVSDDGFIRRFEREAETIAALSHPHIVKLFDYGQQDDLLYVVMELLTGGDLDTLLQSGALPLPMTERLLGQMAEALDYAHERQIIHRDLKPPNILLDQHSNAFLSDFGIAKMLQASTTLTGTGSIVGTPAYIAPEYWNGNPVSSQSDIYSLGIVVYQMLSGRIPFQAETPLRMMWLHESTPPPPIENLSLEMTRVIQKALAKKPEDRYASATSFAQAFREASHDPAIPVITRPTPEAIQSIDTTAALSTPPPLSFNQPTITPTMTPPVPLEGRPTPRPTTLILPKLLRSKRGPLTIGGLALGVVVLVVLLGILASQLNGRGSDVSSAGGTQTGANSASATQIKGIIARAATSTPTVRPSETPSSTAPPPTETATATVPTTTPTERPTNTPSATNTPIPPTATATVTPTVPTVTLTKRPTVTPSATNTPISPTSTDTSSPTTQSPTNTAIPSAAVIAQKKTATRIPRPSDTPTAPPTIADSPVPPSDVPATVPPTSAPTGIPTAGTLVAELPAADSHPVIAPANVAQLQSFRSLSRFRGVLGRSAFNAGGTAVIFSFYDGNDYTVRYYDLARGEMRAACLTANATFSLNGASIAVLNSDGNIDLRDVLTCTTRTTLKPSSSHVTDIQFSPDGKFLVSGHQDGTVRLWSLATAQVLTVSRTGSQIDQLAFRGDGGGLAAALHNGTVWVWDVIATSSASTNTAIMTLKPVGSLVTHLSTVNDLAFSLDGRLAIAGAGTSVGGSLQLWDTKGGKTLQLSGNGFAVKSIAFNRDGSLLIGAADDKTLRVWSLDDNRQFFQTALGASVTSMALSGDGATLVFTSSDGGIQLWGAPVQP